MADFSYTPKFHHFAWVDNVDRCEAGGTNGFNIRFETIEGDLGGVSTVVAQIGTELDRLAARVPTVPRTVTVSFAPALQPVPGSGAVGAWALQNSGNAVAPASAAPGGMLPLALPDRVTVTSLRVCGRGAPPSGQNTTFFFNRVSVTDGGVQRIVSFDTGTVPLNTEVPLPPSQLTVVDLANYRYVISANSGVATADPVTLVSFQFTYTNP
ncbi:hypothetical protein [Streptomyces geranii]|uniref:hypothetical protein n=1 Tax=Streptomyces geranii TaxID=2058923 RepID=UPI000D039C85|nr:hypothetical protein [Streptomyces geranii]